MRGLLLLSVVLAATVLATVAPGAAHAAVPCRNLIYNDWYKDGKIASTYPIACYRDALTHLRADAQIYSSLSTDIRSALQGALARKKGQAGVPAQIGKGSPPVQTSSVKEAVKTLHPKVAVPESAPASERHLATSGDVASSGSSGVPLPILVLGGLALLLAATGAIGAGVRRQRRR
jgi:hypothetical protein